MKHAFFAFGFVSFVFWIPSAAGGAGVTFYTLEDLGPLGGPAQSLGFPMSGVRCRIGSANGINENGDIVATRIDSSGNPYVTVNNQVLPVSHGPAVGCAISDDGYVVGGDAFGGKLWEKQGSGYVEYASYRPQFSTRSVLLAVSSTAPYFAGPYYGFAVAGIYETSSGQLKTFIDNLFMDLSLVHTELDEGSVINDIEQDPPRSGRFFHVGAFRDEEAVSRPYWALLQPSGQQLFEAEKERGVFHAINNLGAYTGCFGVSGSQRATILGTRKRRPHASTDKTCTFDLNDHDIAVGRKGSTPIGYIYSPDGQRYEFDGQIYNTPFIEPGPENWKVEEIVGINNGGVMAANATATIGGVMERRVVRLVPTVVPVLVQVDGNWEYHPSVNGPFLRAEEKFKIQIFLDRPVPNYDRQLQAYAGRLFGTPGAWIILPPLQQMVEVEAQAPNRFQYPSIEVITIELNGVHVGTEVTFVNSKEGYCSDGFDNDLDGLLDCEDDDCDELWCEHPSGLDARCREGVCTAVEPECDDGEDDDLDGLIDCEDEDCRNMKCAPGMYCLEDADTGIVSCSPPPSELICTYPDAYSPTLKCPANCYDAVDQDQDTKVDCADSDCDGQPCNPDGGAICGQGDCLETWCNNRIDDDDDGDVDCQDWECDLKPCEVVPLGRAQCREQRCVELDCCNGLDDDGENGADCKDPDCAGVECKGIPDMGVCYCVVETMRCESCLDCAFEECEGKPCAGGGVCQGGKCVN